MGMFVLIVLAVAAIAAVLVLAAVCAPAQDLAAAGVVVGPDARCLMPDAFPCAEVAGPEQLEFVGPLLVCNVCDRVRTRPGHWVAGGCAPFGGVAAIRAAGRAEECVCRWCASTQRERARCGAAEEGVGQKG